MNERPGPKHTIRVWVREYTGSGKYGKSVTETVYDIPFDEVIKRIRKALG